MVEDTIINYEQEIISFPFFPLSSLPPLSLLRFPPSSYFEKYCKDIYGLRDNEIVYVWEQYKNIVLNKIDE